MNIDCFKAYDVRGRVPDQLNEEVARRIGRAYAAFLQPQRVAVGRDIRHSSAALCDSLCRGLCEGGADVLDLGLCGTEEVYFAAFHHQLDGGIMVTASHNPMDYNGMKLVRECARPLTGDNGLPAIRERAQEGVFAPAARLGVREADLDKSAYIEHLLGYIDRAVLRPLRVVVNAGNGCAGPVIDLLAEHLPFELIRLQHTPDGDFPNGIPNPLLPENRGVTSAAVLEHDADLGLAWDGDFDRCFFFDEQGRFIEGYYLVGLLASALLPREPGAAIVHDPRMVWNTVDLIAQHNGRAVQSRTGHAFMKQVMREHDAVYGGEMSAHHYFRDFAYCDSGMIPWLLITELLSREARPLSSLVDERIQAFPCSGEINFRVEDSAAVIERIRAHYASAPHEIDTTDGVGMNFEQWRFNLRASNTEPLLRLNIETRADADLLAQRTAELRALIEA